MLEKALHQIRDLVVPKEARDFNFNRYHGKDLQAEVVLDAALTLPIFSSRRLVLIKDAQNLSAPQLEAFLPYVKNAVPETVMVFTADKIDGRKKFFQEFKKHGELVEFKKLYENQIPAFVKEQAREAGCTFTEDALAHFCKRVGSNLQEVRGELTKLFDYLGKKSLVDVKDVEAIVSNTRLDSVFALTNALGRRDRGESLLVLGGLIEEGTAPLVILSMMVRHFRQLWKTRELLEQGVGQRDLPRRIGVNPYFLTDLISQARRFDPACYRRFFEIFLGADLALKSSGAHPTAILENLVLQIADSETSRPRRQ